MALFAAQLQPWEEHQSPSPTETTDNQNPYELALARSRSSSKSNHHNKSPSPSSGDSHTQSHYSKPSSPINTLHRQLSGDPDAPPPAWKRRPSVNGRIPPSGPPSRSPSSGPPSASRRHPGLQMTLSSGLKQPLPDQMFLHESPNNSSTDLAELGLPQPAFRRRSNASGLSSNRSSMHSLNGLTSEELWKMDQEANQPDLSNPNRQARERPLDTVRRMSRTFEQPSPGQFGLPGEVIWPSAMPEDQGPPVSAALRSKSTTSITNIAKSKKLTIRKRGSRNQSFDTPPNDVYLHGQTTSPNSLSRPESMIITSSAHSSTTSLNSQGFSPLKLTGNRPPSAYYSRDFLSSLAPREGGYAIAATMGNGLGAHGTMSVDERRRSQVPDMGKRAPMAKSAGMGRWSLDGGEHYARPYGTPSAATTASNLSGPPITSPDVSPPSSEAQLPEGAALPMAPGTSVSMTPSSTISTSDSPTPVLTIPRDPSPLSQQTHAHDMSTPVNERSSAPLASASSPALLNKRSKKDLAKEAKAEAMRQKMDEHKRKAEEKAAAIKAKADKKQAEAKAKEDAKRKEKEEKERRKAEKRGKKVPVVKPIPVPAPAPAPAALQQSGPVPFPRTPEASTTAGPPAPAAVPSQAGAPVSPRRKAQSMPLGSGSNPPITSSSTPSQSQFGQGIKSKASESTLKTQQSSSKPKLGFLGTLKKRFSSGPSSASPDVRAKARQADHTANLGSMPPAPSSSGFSSSTVGPRQREQEVRSSSMAAGTFVPSSPAPANFASAPVVNVQPPPDDFAPQLENPSEADQYVVPASTTIQISPSPSARSLSKVVSRDQTRSRSASVHSRTRSASLKGPRPMPSTSTVRTSPRPESIAVSHPPAEGVAGFPFRPLGQEIPGSVSTPTTSAESSEFSNNSNSGHVSSPFTSINSQTEGEGEESRKNSLDAGRELERTDSTTPKASDETVGQTQGQIESRQAVFA